MKREYLTPETQMLESNMEGFVCASGTDGGNGIGDIDFIDGGKE